MFTSSKKSFNLHLRVVRTQVILFWKSISEKVGFDIKRLLMTPFANGFESIQKFNFSVVLCRIQPFPTLISKIKWLGSELPLSILQMVQSINKPKSLISSKMGPVDGSSIDGRKHSDSISRQQKG